MAELRSSHLAALAAGIVLSLSTSGAFAFSASFSWCPGSPRFALADVPQATAKLDFQMTDLNKPSFHHGGGTVDYRGQPEVPCGAFAKCFVGHRRRRAKCILTSSLSKRSAPMARRWRPQPRGGSFRSKSRFRLHNAVYVAFRCHD